MQISVRRRFNRKNIDEKQKTNWLLLMFVSNQYIASQMFEKS